MLPVIDAALVLRNDYFGESVSHSVSPCVATTSTYKLFACAFSEGVARSVPCQDVFVFAFRAVWRSMPAMLKSEPFAFGGTKDGTSLFEVTNSLVYLFWQLLDVL